MQCTFIWFLHYHEQKLCFRKFRKKIELILFSRWQGPQLGSDGRWDILSYRSHEFFLFQKPSPFSHQGWSIAYSQGPEIIYRYIAPKHRLSKFEQSVIENLMPIFWLSGVYTTAFCSRDYWRKLDRLLIFEKKLFQFWREIWILVVVIWLQL